MADARQLQQLIDVALDSRGRDRETDALLELGDYVRRNGDVIVRGVEFECAVRRAKGKPTTTTEERRS